MRAGPTAKALWGSATSGVPPGRMRALRIAAAKSVGRLPAGAALSYVLQCTPRGWRQDPLVVATGLAVQAFSSATWAKQAWPAAVQACLQSAERLQHCQRPWAAV